MISIIIPAYNSGRFIGETIESILHQNYNEYEIIIIDDGSQDSTADVCNWYINQNSNIHYYRQENRGVSAARNYGIELSNGEYLFFMDADDTMPEDALRTLFMDMCNNDIQGVFGNYNYQYNKKKIKRKNRISPGRHNIKELASMLIDDGTLSGIMFGSVWGVLYKTAIIKEHDIRFRENLKVNEDGIFNIEYCMNIEALWYETDAVYNYRQWKTGEKKDTNYIDVMQKRYEDSNNTLRNEIQNQFTQMDRFKNQMEARRFTCVFQMSLIICKYGYDIAKRLLKTLWESNRVEDSKSVLCFDRLNIYKRLLWRMVLNGNRFSFWLSVHYVYPIICSVVKR